MCGVSILWVPIIKSSSGGKLFTYMTAVEGYIAAPLGVIFLFSIFWTKTTEPVSLIFEMIPVTVLVACLLIYIDIVLDSK